MAVYIYSTVGNSKGIVYADYEFEAESMVADFYRIECENVKLQQIESLEELREHVKKSGEVIAFL